MEFKIIKYTNDDIIKAAILCSSGEYPKMCQECPMNNKNCGEVMRKAIAEILKNQKEDNERLYNENEALISAQETLQKHIEKQIEKAKAEAIKEVVGRLQKSIISQLGISTLEKKEAFLFCLDEIDKIEKELVGDNE